MLKTGHYRNASLVLGNNITAGQAIGACIDGYPNEGHPIFSYTDELDCAVVSHTQQHGREMLHLAVFEEGAGAAVLETIANVRVNEEQAPEEKEFIRSQVFLICSDSDVTFTTHNSPLRDSRVNVLINSLIESFGGFQDTPSFLLQAALDEERYREVMDQGIGELDLGVGGFQQTLEHAVQRGRVAQGGLVDVISSLWKRDLTQEDRRAAEKITGRFILRPGHDWDNAEVKAIMTEMAMELLNEGNDDGFAIVTKNGLRVTQDSVRLSDSFHVDGNRQIVNQQQMFSGLQDCFGTFIDMGVIGNEDAVIDVQDG